MAGSVNSVTLIGNLGKDPEVRNTQSGSKIVNLTLATSDTWNDRQSGERKERVEWHRVVIFNERLAGVAERFLSKGRKIFVTGCLRTRKWTDQSGQEKFTTEVVLENFRGELVILDSKPQDGGNQSGGYGNNSRDDRGGWGGNGAAFGNQSRGGGGWDAPPDNDLDDSIPF